MDKFLIQIFVVGTGVEGFPLDEISDSADFIFLGTEDDAQTALFALCAANPQSQGGNVCPFDTAQAIYRDEYLSSLPTVNVSGEIIRPDGRRA